MNESANARSHEYNGGCACVSGQPAGLAMGVGRQSGGQLPGVGAGAVGVGRQSGGQPPGVGAGAVGVGRQSGGHASSFGACAGAVPVGLHSGGHRSSVGVGMHSGGQISGGAAGSTLLTSSCSVRSSAPVAGWLRPGLTPMVTITAVAHAARPTAANHDLIAARCAADRGAMVLRFMSAALWWIANGNRKAAVTGGNEQTFAMNNECKTRHQITAADGH